MEKERNERIFDRMEREHRLTAGAITPQLLRLCLPLLAANVLQQCYNIINSLVVTYYIGDNAFAALGVAESVMNLFVYMITGACMGASVLVARFYGEGNFARLRQQLYVSAVLMGGCTLTGVTLGQLFLPQLLRLIQTPEELMADASAYLRIILAGMLFTFSYHYLASILRAVGDTKAALYFLLLSLGYNLVCAWVLVALFQMGIVGTAMATATAQLLSTTLCFLYLHKKYPALMLQPEDRKMDGTLARLTSSYAAVAALQQSSLYLGKLLIQGAVNGLGTEAISAFTAATRVENFIQAFGISGCEATAIFVAQNKGAKQPDRCLKGFIWGSVGLVAVGIFFALLLYTVPELMLSLFLEEETQRWTLGTSYLRLIGLSYYLSFGGHAFVSWYRGTGRMNITFWGTTIQIAVRVVGTYWLVDAMALDSVALSTGIGWMVIVWFHGTVFWLERKGIWPKRRDE